MSNQYESDIPLSLFIDAHRGVSISPDARGARESAAYAQALTHDYELFRRHAEIGGTLEKLDAEFARYRAGHADRTRAHLSSLSRCLSVLASGRSNFPIARMQKRNSIADRREKEIVEYRERATKAIIRNLRPDLRPIMAGDDDACEQLRAKLVEAEASQKEMKLVNATLRANKEKDKKVAALLALNIDPQRVAELTTLRHGNIGFPAWQLTNNNANIRRMRERLAQLELAKATPTVERKGVAATLEDDPPANRVRLIFPGKPEESVRSRLKSAGFRWSPSIGAWQAYRNAHTLAVAQQVAA